MSDIDANIMKRFETELKACGLQLNTISFYIRNIKAIYNKAVKDGYVEQKKEDPFKKVYTKTQKTRKRALTLNEMNALYKLDFDQLLRKQDDTIVSNKDIENERLYYSWRLFFFCFYARGMSFVDLAYLRKENMQKGFISYYRKKSGQYISIKVTQVMKQIINSFKDDVKHSQYLFPIITDPSRSHRIQYESALRTQNKRLKKLSKIANLNSIITTHVSRHSWASIAKVVNLPISVISEGLGHANQSTTSIYLSSFNHAVLDNANDIVTDAISNNNLCYQAI